MDALAIVLAAAHPGLWWYYALMATAGAVIGALAAYRVALKGGKAAIEKEFGDKRFQKAHRYLPADGILVGVYRRHSAASGADFRVHHGRRSAGISVASFFAGNFIRAPDSLLRDHLGGLALRPPDLPFSWPAITGRHCGPWWELQSRAQSPRWCITCGFGAAQRRSATEPPEIRRRERVRVSRFSLRFKVSRFKVSSFAISEVSTGWGSKASRLSGSVTAIRRNYPTLTQLHAQSAGQHSRQIEI